MAEKCFFFENNKKSLVWFDFDPNLINFGYTFQPIPTLASIRILLCIDVNCQKKKELIKVKCQVSTDAPLNH